MISVPDVLVTHHKYIYIHVNLFKCIFGAYKQETTGTEGLKHSFCKGCAACCDALDLFD